jgi:hypothetical protein
MTGASENGKSAQIALFSTLKEAHVIFFSHEIVLPLLIKNTFLGGINSANRLATGLIPHSGAQPGLG